MTAPRSKGEAEEEVCLSHNASCSGAAYTACSLHGCESHATQRRVGLGGGRGVLSVRILRGIERYSIIYGPVPDAEGTIGEVELPQLPLT